MNCNEIRKIVDGSKGNRNDVFFELTEFICPTSAPKMLKSECDKVKNKFMYDAPKAKNEKNIISNAHFKNIINGNCEDNTVELYNKCAKLAYTTADTLEKCPKERGECVKSKWSTE